MVHDALRAVVLWAGGDRDGALDHLSEAQAQSRVAARRDRQLIEIALAIVSGDNDRATGLAAEHRSAFPDDTEALTALLTTARLQGGW